jgi:hypothetical protein
MRREIMATDLLQRNDNLLENEQPHINDEDTILSIKDMEMFQEPQGIFILNRQRHLDVIAADILNEKQKAVESFWNIGRCLKEAKSQIEHGKWGPWLRDKCDFSEDSARNYVNLYDGYLNPEALRNLPFTKALKMLDIPQECRDEFLSKPHIINGETKFIEDMSSREVATVVNEHKQMLTMNNSDKEKENAGNEINTSKAVDINSENGKIDFDEAAEDSIQNDFENDFGKQDNVDKDIITDTLKQVIYPYTLDDFNTDFIKLEKVLDKIFDGAVTIVIPEEKYSCATDLSELPGRIIERLKDDGLYVMDTEDFDIGSEVDNETSVWLS